MRGARCHPRRMTDWTTIDLSGRHAVVTGASRGIGLATAQTLLAAGARVSLLARSAEALAAEVERLGERARYRVCDLSDGAATRALIGDIDAGDPIDILVNNAGTIQPIGMIWEQDAADWERAVALNLVGVFSTLRAVLPGMIARGSGTVVNLSSGAANGALPGWSHYCATKAGVQRLTQVAGRELREAGHPVTVVGLSPGTVATDMMQSIRASGVNAVSQLPWERHIPPSDAAKAVLWLCGPGGRAHAGADFSIKTPEGRAAVGLTPL